MNILVTGANGQLGNEMRIVTRGSKDKYIFTDVVEASEETGKNYQLIIICEGEEIRVPVPTDISANMFYEKDRIKAQGKIVKIR